MNAAGIVIQSGWCIEIEAERTFEKPTKGDLRHIDVERRGCRRFQADEEFGRIACSRRIEVAKVESIEDGTHFARLEAVLTPLAQAVGVEPEPKVDSHCRLEPERAENRWIDRQLRS